MPQISVSKLTEKMVGWSCSEDAIENGGRMIKIRVFHCAYLLRLIVPANCTFGEVKEILAKETGLAPQKQQLIFRGKENHNEEFLHLAGVKNMSKIILLDHLDHSNSKGQKLEETKKDEGVLRSCEAIASIRAEVDKLADKVTIIETTIPRGTSTEKEVVTLTELLMAQLLKLDSTEAEGEARDQRRAEVRRILNFVEKLDALKVRISNPINNSCSLNLHAVSESTNSNSSSRHSSIDAKDALNSSKHNSVKSRRSSFGDLHDELNSRNSSFSSKNSQGNLNSISSLLEKVNIRKSRNSNPFSNGSYEDILQTLNSKNFSIFSNSSFEETPGTVQLKDFITFNNSSFEDTNDSLELSARTAETERKLSDTKLGRLKKPIVVPSPLLLLLLTK